ncbi:hypothetical protein EJ110_NYTH32021 [Nymphaea thermarum]|nr:hypothetical protein EJ110_NYTH32021 [Nymphaea thermarum]
MAERITACDANATVEQHGNQVEAVIGDLEWQMHGMDQRLNTMDARLEAMLVEQQAMSALLRGSLQQGSRHQSLDSDQTQSDELKEQGLPRNGGATWRPTKMDFLLFSGDDPINWVFRAKQYFDCQGIAGDERVCHAMVYFEGVAVCWFCSLVLQKGRPAWATLVKELTARFGPSAYLDYNVELSSIKQSGTVLEYQEHFEVLMSMVRGWPLPALIGTFLVARTVEEKNERLHTITRGTFSRTWQDVRTSPCETFHKTWPDARNNPQGKLKSDVFSPAPRKNQKGNAPHQVVRDLTPEQIKEKRRLNQCFHCDQPYVLGHNCRCLHMYLVEESDKPLEADATPPLPIEPEVMENKTVPEVLLHALAGDEVPHLMRVEGKLRGRPVSMLIGTGSTHHFICEKSVWALGCHMEVQPTFDVVVADRSTLRCRGKCQMERLEIQGFHFPVQLYILAMAGADLLLGI